MQVFTSLLALVAVVAPALAVPVIEERAATTCGSTYYSATQVNQAAQKACTYYKAGSTANSYPHTYNNFEGFSFPISGPYLEFPMLSSGVYTGGSPGADRVIINTSCKLAGAITHTGASGNNFVGCSGTR
ncbi:Ribonuclease/ribotoxin [Xylaria bambusicola]|uniref:Ribonuclease/ribotoxin n=1 Tax=Xylaria bambusicola TaxID=326684 RepID=UPI0020071FEE|nr:Ribonuclease/ribotoxin [Xylaria bambusicola]KAI0514333.1 Ribonuclease/ribotoxin [Xylaria bambusicola]